MRERLEHWTGGQEIPRVPYFARLLLVVNCPQADVTRVGGSPSSSASPGSPAPMAVGCPRTAPLTCMSPRPARRPPGLGLEFRRVDAEPYRVG
jgi:hypothetical protein